MPAYISPRRAYDIASNWGCAISNGGSGACFYGFHFNDGRPVSDQHRSDCLIYARSLLRIDDLSVSDERELRQLIRFLANCPLYAKAAA